MDFELLLIDFFQVWWGNQLVRYIEYQQSETINIGVEQEEGMHNDYIRNCKDL